MKIELHLHTHYSKCSNIKPDDLIKHCFHNAIRVIAVTDHNTLAGVKALQSKKPDWLGIITGEEISTLNGEIIGLFLKREISGKNKTVLQVAEEIKAQGGLVLLPHPFDKFRKAIDHDYYSLLLNYVDLFEVFNSRCMFKAFNENAKVFARENELLGSVGSDAHFVNELGNSMIYIDDFATPKEFIERMQEASFTYKYANPFVHIRSALNKLTSNHRHD